MKYILTNGFDGEPLFVYEVAPKYQNARFDCPRAFCCWSEVQIFADLIGKKIVERPFDGDGPWVVGFWKLI